MPSGRIGSSTLRAIVARFRANKTWRIFIGVTIRRQISGHRDGFVFTILIYRALLKIIVSRKYSRPSLSFFRLLLHWPDCPITDNIYSRVSTDANARKSEPDIYLLNPARGFAKKKVSFCYMLQNRT